MDNCINYSPNCAYRFHLLHIGHHRGTLSHRLSSLFRYISSMVIKKIHNTYCDIFVGKFYYLSTVANWSILTKFYTFGYSQHTPFVFHSYHYRFTMLQSFLNWKLDLTKMIINLILTQPRCESTRITFPSTIYGWISSLWVWALLLFWYRSTP